MPSTSTFKKSLFALSGAYILIVVVIYASSLFLPAFRNVGHLERGCYWTDALIVYVECTGIPAAQALEYAINLPLNLLYLPSFGLVGLFDGYWVALLTLLHGVILWLPVVYFLWRLLYLAKPKSE